MRERLQGHPIWQRPRFWEEALRGNVLEELSRNRQPPWHEMDADARRDAVSCVQRIVESQLIAFAHSMLESGCSARMASGFVRRMCAIYQLGEDQRAQLLAILRESRGE